MSNDPTKALGDEISRLYGRNMIASSALLAKRFVTDHPRRAVYWLYRGMSLGQLSRFPEALVSLRRAARLFHRSRIYLVYYHFGQLYEWKGEFRLAERWYRRMIKASPSDSGGYVKLGRILAKSGRLLEAAAIQRRATRCREGCREEAFLFLGYVLRSLERYREARTCFRRALDIDPKYKEAKRALADVEYVSNASRDT